MTELHRKVRETIRRHRMFRAGDGVGVAVSAGADSVALLLLLEDLRGELGIRLRVLHFNHQLRGAESEADEHFVAELARSRGLEFLFARADVAGEARRNRWNLEEAARRLRYGFFEEVMNSGRVDRVAVAHTADDQAETVLAHLLRGTGLTGLASIYPVRSGVVRPLLDVRRQDVRAYLAGRSQAWREDPTNQDVTRLRARIRHRLLPLLDRDFQPRIVPHLAELAAQAREEDCFWRALVEDRFRAVVRSEASGLSIPASELVAPLPVEPGGSAAAGGKPPAGAPEVFESPVTPGEALSRRLVRRIVEGLPGDRQQLTARHVEQVMGLARGGGGLQSGRRMQLPGGVVVERIFNRICFSKEVVRSVPARCGGTRRAAGAYEYKVELPAQPGDSSTALEIPEIGTRFRLKLIDWLTAQSETREGAEALDLDLLTPPLILRNWQPGDAYRPCGRQRPRKLKELFRDGRVDARERARWPVLTSCGRVAWARGFPVAAEFSTTPATRVGLVILEEGL